MTANTTIEMYRGDSNLVQVACSYTDVNGTTTPLDCTGSTSTFLVKGVGGSAQVLNLAGSVVSTNEIQFTFLPNDTTLLSAESYIYEIVVTTLLGNIYTVVTGVFKILDPFAR